MIQCGFFNSENDDRKYTAEQMNYPYSDIVSDGVFANGNGYLSNQLQVQATNSLQVIVKKGKGIFDKKWFISDSDEKFTINTPNTALPRIDSFFIEIDNVLRVGKIIYKVGTPATIPTPIKREFNSDRKWFRLADVYVPANSVNITQANITDTRPLEECGIVTNLLANSDITATYSQWSKQFYDWFNNLKQTVSSVTAISSYSSQYITISQDEVQIPINISQYYSVVDILQVYINGLLLVPNVDYTIVNYSYIKLKKGVDIGTPISFIVYKSIDGNSAVSAFELMQTIENRVTALEKPVKTALWSGASQMGDGVTITPVKKLSDCKNGWLLLWSDYDTATGKAVASEFVTTFIPKGLQTDFGINSAVHFFTIPSMMLADGSYYLTVKRLSSTDSALLGHVANTATDNGKDTCLIAVYEF